MQDGVNERTPINGSLNGPPPAAAGEGGEDGAGQDGHAAAAASATGAGGGRGPGMSGAVAQTLLARAQGGAGAAGGGGYQALDRSESTMTSHTHIATASPSTPGSKRSKWAAPRLAFHFIRKAKGLSKDRRAAQAALRNTSDGSVTGEDSMHAGAAAAALAAAAGERRQSDKLDALDDQEPPQSEMSKVWEMMWDKLWLNCFLVLLPLGYAAHVLQWSPALVFFLNFFAMIPLASLLGDFTEELAVHLGQTIGGLVNATFGNAVEVVVAIQALKQNQIRVVQSSMLGSVLSNLLLVLGCCFFCGGFNRQFQKFNVTSALANTSLLFLSTLALLLSSNYDDEANVLTISRVSAIFMLAMYIQLLFFQLRTHASIFVEDDGDDEANLTVWTAGIGLGVTTLLVSIFSEFLVSAIDGTCESVGMSTSFVGLILLPIIGNAVEHVTAVSVAMKDKMELSMGVAVGSAVQISLFVVPVIVLSGWAMGREMDLDFPGFEVNILMFSVLITFATVVSGRSHWLEGSMLVTTYTMIAVALWFESPDP